MDSLLEENPIYREGDHVFGLKKLSERLKKREERMVEEELEIENTN